MNQVSKRFRWAVLTFLVVAMLSGIMGTVPVMAAAPTVTTISPASGPLAGGTAVTITGTGFVDGATTVAIGGAPATSVVYGSGTSITAVTPAGSAGPQDVMVTTIDGPGTLTGGFTYLTTPTVTNISPSSGPLAGGTAVMITGTGFVDGATVAIGGNAATSVVFGSTTSITAVTPAGTAGAKNVVVTTPGGSGTLTSGFTYLAVPTVTNISPSSGPLAGGTAVTITGTGFVSGATVAVGGNAATSVVVVSGTSITAVTPAGTAGAKDVVVTTAGGSGTLTSGFTYMVVTVTNISPASGPLEGGTAVTITGTGFVGGAEVTIGGNEATSIVVVSGTSITAVTPAGTAGAKDVVVTTAGGSGTLTSGFSYMVVTVTTISPSSGPLAGGTAVTITGTGFVSGATVAIGGASATSVVVVNATSITAVTPAGTAGAKNVVVTTAGGSGTLTNGFTYLAAPTVTNISPASGPLAGGTAVTITGTGFVSGATVSVGGTAATSVVVVSGTSITAVTPAGTAGAKDVVVTTPGGTGTRTGGFTYLAAPTVSSISPPSGSIAGGTAVTITGTGFVSGATVAVGGNAATSVVVVSATSITAITPAGTAGAKDVVVTTPGGSGTLTSGFTYLAVTVTTISPSSGPLAGGTAVTITGTGFVSGATVTIGGASATSVVVVSGTSITAVTPAGSAGAKDVVVTTSGGSATLTNGFTYMVVTVTTISPTSGPLAGGTAVTITGTGFVSGATVTIGGASATSVVVVSATSITAVTPAGTAGAKDVVVTTPGGSGTLTSGFTYLAAPTVSSISPTSGPASGGTAVTITGTGFVSGATVAIGGASATSVVVVSATSITAVTPAGTAGAKDVVVTTPGGSGTLTSGFTYLAVTVTSISPASGSAVGGTAVTITGTGFVSGATVTIGGASATSVVVVSATSITAVTPAGTIGARNVVVTTSGGSATLTNGFTYLENWWNTSWTKRKQVTITNGTPSDLTTYEVRIPVTYDTDMNADFSDIRFYASDNTTALSHWRNKVVSSTSAEFWVNIPSIPASGSVAIYMYYGYPSAITASNIHTTFMFGDDFEDPAWTATHIYANNVGGTTTEGIVLDGTNHVYEQSAVNDPDPLSQTKSETLIEVGQQGVLTQFPENYVVDIDVKPMIPDGGAFITGRYADVSYKFEQVLTFGLNQLSINVVDVDIWSNILAGQTISPPTVVGNWYTMHGAILWGADPADNIVKNILNVGVDGITTTNVYNTHLPATTYHGLAILSYNHTGPYDTQFDNWRVRHYAYAEPGYAFSAEQTPGSTPTPPPSGGGGGFFPTTTVVNLTGFTSEPQLIVDNLGVVQSDVELKSANGKISIKIAKGTKLLDIDGMPLTRLTLEENITAAAAPDKQAIALAFKLGLDGAKFSPAITLTVKYDTKDLPEGSKVEDLKIAYWDGKVWQSVAGTVNAASGTVSAPISHFTPFALLANVPAPASFVTSNLKISPASVTVGEKPVISVTVTNTGGLAGKYSVSLLINGAHEATAEVNLAAGASQEVSFTVERTQPAVYNAQIGELTGKFLVKEAAVTPSPTPPVETGTPVPASPTPSPTDTPVVPPSDNTGWIIGAFITFGLVGIIGGIIVAKRRMAQRQNS